MFDCPKECHFCGAKDAGFTRLEFRDADAGATISTWFRCHQCGNHLEPVGGEKPPPYAEQADEPGPDLEGMDLPDENDPERDGR